MRASDPKYRLCDALAAVLHKPTDDPYIGDLADVVRAVCPALLDLLHGVEGSVELVWHSDGSLYMRPQTARFEQYKKLI